MKTTTIMYTVKYLCIQYAKPWPHSDIRSCCRQSLLTFTSRYDSTLLGCIFINQRCSCMRLVCTYCQTLYLCSISSTLYYFLLPNVSCNWEMVVAKIFFFLWNVATSTYCGCNGHLVQLSVTIYNKDLTKIWLVTWPLFCHL